MTPEQLHQIEQARRYAEQDEYAVTRAHIRNLLAIIEGQVASAPKLSGATHVRRPECGRVVEIEFFDEEEAKEFVFSLISVASPDVIHE